MDPHAVTSSLTPDLQGPWPADTSAAAAAAADEQAAVDHFDRLPDSVLLLVFNEIGDVKALGRCCAVSRRFHDLVPLVDNVLVRVDCVISDDDHHNPATTTTPSSSSGKPRGLFSHLARLVLGAASSVCKRLSSSSSSAAASASSPSEVSHHSPTEVLRNFKEIRRLRIELPTGELGDDDGILLQWKASFGSTLDRCVILGANSVLSSGAPPQSFLSAAEKGGAADPNNTGGDGFFRDAGENDDNGGIPESFYTNGSLKLRVVWTISSLIAASARHFLLQPIIADHESLESLELTDADGQGVLRMGRRQLEELRVRPISVSGSSQRTLVPALNMRLWYAQHLELPVGVVLKGATLVAVRPSESPAVAGGEGEGQDNGWMAGAFEEPYGSAVRELVKRRTFCLEMNSF